MSEDLGLEPDATEEDQHGTSRSKEDYEREIRELRKEAAGRRVSNKEQAKELEEFKTWKESQKTELQRLAEAKEEAERNLAELRREKLQAKAAREAGLDPDLADRIRGDSEDEMLEDARQLAERAGKRTQGEIDPFAGRRGEPVGPAVDASASFNKWIRNG